MFVAKAREGQKEMSQLRDLGNQQLMSPAARASFDYLFFGSNENPYKANTGDWEQYEQHFDTMVMEAERR